MEYGLFFSAKSQKFAHQLAHSSQVTTEKSLRSVIAKQTREDIGLLLKSGHEQVAMLLERLLYMVWDLQVGPELIWFEYGSITVEELATLIRSFDDQNGKAEELIEMISKAIFDDEGNGSVENKCEEVM